MDVTARTAVPGALVLWARLPGSAALLAQVRTKLERGARGNRVTVGADLTPEHRRDVGRLLGIRWEISGAPATLGKLRDAMSSVSTAAADDGPGVHGASGDGDGDGLGLDPLEVLLTATTGPVRDLPGEKLHAAQVRASHRSQVLDLLEGAGVPAPAAALAVQRRWLGDGEGAVELAALVARLVAWLVTKRAMGGTPLLAEAAQQLYGNPHALDRNQALGRAAVRVLDASQAFVTGVDPDELVVASDGALMAARWREVWETAGVQCDRVSATVLVVNVTLTGDAAAAALSSVPGEPVWLTARSLSGLWAPTPGLGVVRVCENPSVTEAAADELGSACPPLVCTYGRPSTAAHTLLRGLHTVGVRLMVSADRDVAGNQISAELLARYPGAEPWCPDLVGVFEEERLPGLLADLRASHRPLSGGA